MRSKVDPMKDVAAMIRTHFDGIVAWTQTRKTNGFIEAVNGLFQAAKRKARGYTRFHTMKTVLFLIAGLINKPPCRRLIHSRFKRAKELMGALLTPPLPPAPSALDCRPQLPLRADMPLFKFLTSPGW
jgi:hypothetical protein